eukprot:TRINITY_DN101650_c0_g1_i1.p1 TRINITY_DN101650_c0_g1~~TRINITY_DN101650_c0_g1_i1.p1  ORF type:complete len:440 (-),score=141.87 TRINITY_DN101650_c0_g1_i1:129-1448(-)
MPFPALMSLERELSQQSWQDEIRMATTVMFQKDNHYTLFKYEDWPAWVIFSTVFAVLIVVDNVVMNRNPKSMTMSFAVLYTLFWVFCACCFCGWVYWYYSPASAFMWMSGYLLEWMLSFDNLFVFHLIFNVYGTPDHLKHKALFLGICGAVFFRVVFIFVGEYLMHAMFFMHFVFGGFLIYTGVKTMLTDDEDEDPSQHPMVQFLQRQVPFVSMYDRSGAFFVRVPVDERGQANVGGMDPADGGEAAILTPSTMASSNDSLDKKGGYGTVDFQMVDAKFGGQQQRTQTRATMLLLVVFCLEISDLLFAVDSVSAIVAQVNDLFLAYTSAVFAMLGLRATFFIIDVLAKMFSLLKYGVGIVLIFIGFKLCIGRYYHVPPAIVCGVLFSAIGGSMVASLIKEKYWPEEDEEEEDNKSSSYGSAKASPAGTPIVPGRTAVLA